MRKIRNALLLGALSLLFAFGATACDFLNEGANSSSGTSAQESASSSSSSGETPAPEDGEKPAPENPEDGEKPAPENPEDEEKPAPENPEDEEKPAPENPDDSDKEEGGGTVTDPNLETVTYMVTFIDTTHHGVTREEELTVEVGFPFYATVVEMAQKVFTVEMVEYVAFDAEGTCEISAETFADKTQTTVYVWVQTPLLQLAINVYFEGDIYATQINKFCQGDKVWKLKAYLAQNYSYKLSEISLYCDEDKTMLCADEDLLEIGTYWVAIGATGGPSGGAGTDVSVLGSLRAGEFYLYDMYENIVGKASWADIGQFAFTMIEKDESDVPTAVDNFGIAHYYPYDDRAYVAANDGKLYVFGIKDDQNMIWFSTFDREAYKSDGDYSGYAGEYGYATIASGDCGKIQLFENGTFVLITTIDEHKEQIGTFTVKDNKITLTEYEHTIATVVFDSYRRVLREFDENAPPVYPEVDTTLQYQNGGYQLSFGEGGLFFMNQEGMMTEGVWKQGENGVVYLYGNGDQNWTVLLSTDGTFSWA